MTCLSGDSWFTVSCTADGDIPREVLAQFSDSVAYISILYDIATDMATTTCSDLLSASTLALLGTLYECKWHDAFTLAIYPDKDATVAVGASLVTIGGVIRSADSVSDPSPANTLTLTGPANGPVVTAGIVAPTKIGPCDDLTLDASSSTRNAGQALQYDWFVSADLNDDLDSTELDDLNSILAGKGDVEMILLTSEELPTTDSSVIIVFELQVTNWLGDADVSSFNVTKQTEAVPALSLSSPVVLLRAADEVSVQAMSSVPTCLDGDTLDAAEWTVG